MGKSLQTREMVRPETWGKFEVGGSGSARFLRRKGRKMAGFLRTGWDVREVVVWEGAIECRDEVDECLTT